MRELFTNLFNVTVSGSIMIAAAIILRMIFRKTPKAVFCLLWGLIVLRLLIPVQIETRFSLRPEMPVLSVADTSFVEQERTFSFYPSWDERNTLDSELPSFIPQQKLSPQDAVVDYVYIGTLLWALGLAAMLIYTIVTYVHLRIRLREAVRLEKYVFECSRIESPFLLGFFRPRIYLSVHMDEDSRTAVIAHEQAHLRRGDNWFKLVAFLCFAVHWYNPLVWLAYGLLCRDIESACDEAVIRQMDEQGRKDYSSVLLNCQKRRKTVAGCPIAFGEVSVRERILNVLNYQKPVVWVTVIAIVAVTFSGACLLTDPVDDTHPPYCKALMGLLGEPIDAVCTELGFTAEELKQEGVRGIYWVPIESIKYQGIEFDLQLKFAPLNEDTAWVLNGFSYFAESDLDNSFAENVVSLARHLYGKLGRGYQWTQNNQTDPDRLRDFSVEAVQGKLEFNERYNGGGTIVGDHWDLTQTSGEKVQGFLKQIEASQRWGNWKEITDKNYANQPGFYLSFSVEEVEEQGWFKLDYSCGHIPGTYGTGDQEWELEMHGTWWKKLQNWLK